MTIHNNFPPEDFYAQLKRMFELLDELKPTLIITKSDEQRLKPEELKKIQEMVHICHVPDNYLNQGRAYLIPSNKLNYIPKGVPKL